jgi:hypothetical protein
VCCRHRADKLIRIGLACGTLSDAAEHPASKVQSHAAGATIAKLRCLQGRFGYDARHFPRRDESGLPNWLPAHFHGLPGQPCSEFFPKVGSASLAKALCHAIQTTIAVYNGLYDKESKPAGRFLHGVRPRRGRVVHIVYHNGTACKQQNKMPHRCVEAHGPRRLGAKQTSCIA